MNFTKFVLYNYSTCDIECRKMKRRWKGVTFLLVDITCGQTDLAYHQNSSFVPSFPVVSLSVSCPLKISQQHFSFWAAAHFSVRRAGTAALFSCLHRHPTSALRSAVNGSSKLLGVRCSAQITFSLQHWKVFQLVLIKLIHTLWTFCGSFRKVNILMLDLWLELVPHWTQHKVSPCCFQDSMCGSLVLLLHDTLVTSLARGTKRVNFFCFFVGLSSAR